MEMVAGTAMVAVAGTEIEVDSLSLAKKVIPGKPPVWLFRLESRDSCGYPRGGDPIGASLRRGDESADVRSPVRHLLHCW